MDQRFAKHLRLRRASEFDLVFRRRSAVSDGCLVLHGATNSLPDSRLGLAVSRRVGNAVVRNRWKRLLREAFRQQRRRIPPGLDLVVLPRPGVEPALAAISESLVRLSRRLAKRLALPPHSETPTGE